MVVISLSLAKQYFCAILNLLFCVLRVSIKVIQPMATAKLRKTRSSVNTNLFGAPCELKELQLPTYADVMRHYYWLRNEYRGISITTGNDLINMVCDKVTAIWIKASLPVICKQTIKKKIKDYYNKIRSVEKSIKRKGLKDKKNREKFIKNAETSLFDISACKCKDLDRCTCNKGSKVPKREVTFLHDQRTVRQMRIGKIDLQTSKALTNTASRKMKMTANSSTSAIGPSISGIQSTPMLSKSSEYSLRDFVEKSGPNDSEFERILTRDSCKRISLSHTASAAFRTGVSDRDAALIASAVLQDAGLVTIKDKNLVVDKNKIRREKNKLGKRIQEDENLDELKIKSVFFDGRRDKTLFIEKKKKNNTADRKTKNILLCCLNLVPNILGI